MFFRREFGNHLKSQRSAELFAGFDRFLCILFGRGHDVIRAAEYFCVRVFHAADFAARHRVCSDKFKVGAKQALHLFHNAALDARYVRQQRSAFEVLLIFFYPFYKNVRIKRKNNKVEFFDVFGVCFRLSVLDKTVF